LADFQAGYWGHASAAWRCEKQGTGDSPEQLGTHIRRDQPLVDAIASPSRSKTQRYLSRSFQAWFLEERLEFALLPA